MSTRATARHTAVVYAGFWIRVWATVVDSVLAACILWPLMLLIPGAVTTHSNQIALDNALAMYTSVEILLPWPAQFFFTWVLPAIAIIVFWCFRSATPGKMLVSAKIVTADTGAKPSKKQLIGRYLGYFVSTLPLGLGLLWVAFDPRKQGWHDKLARTAVVRTRKDPMPHFATDEAD